MTGYRPTPSHALTAGHPLCLRQDPERRYQWRERARSLARAATFLAASVLLAAVPTTEEIVVRNAEGTPVRPLVTERRAVVLVFTAPDCPISNRYLPRLKEIAALCARNSIDFWLVYPDASVDAEQVRQHRKEYEHALPALLDPEHKLVRRAEATVTPEAAVFATTPDTPGMQLVYRGRIDDTWHDFGVSRPVPTQTDLQDVITALASGEVPELRTTKAVGCYISL